MKISIITTLHHNVGDDFIREGIIYLLKQKYQQTNLKFSFIHKHSPITCRNGFEQYRNYSKYQRWDDLLPLWITKDKILEADLVVQSGAPVYWYHPNISKSTENEWYQPLIIRRFGKKKNQKLINLAAGTAQRYHSDASEFLEDQEIVDYIKELFSLCTVTTLRDKLAQKLLYSLNLKAPVIPCSSIFAIDELGIQKQSPEYVVVNYMPGGAHYTFGQEIDFQHWKNVFTQFYYHLKDQEQIIFACHDDKEINEAKLIDPNAKIFFSDSHIDYLRFYSKAKIGIVNRIHAGYAMASFGVPVTFIGNDTRTLLADEIEASRYFVNDVETETLLNEYRKLLDSMIEYPQLISRIKSKALIDYQSELSII